MRESGRHCRTTRLRRLIDAAHDPGPSNKHTGELLVWADCSSVAEFSKGEKGGFYGVGTTPRRILSEALNANTPVPGLFLTGHLSTL